MTKSKLRHKITKKAKITRRIRKNMKGGAYTQDEEEYLLELGFNQEQINNLNQMNISTQTIYQAVTIYQNNFYNFVLNISQELMNGEIQPNNNVEQIEINNEANPFLNVNDLNGENIEQIENNPDDAHDLDVSGISGNTSIEGDDFSFDDDDENELNANDENELNANDEINANGGKKRTKKRKNNKRRKTHKNLKGGSVFGNGYGSNCNDPNYNIYNTNLLKLFPYNPK